MARRQRDDATEVTERELLLQAEIQDQNRRFAEIVGFNGEYIEALPVNGAPSPEYMNGILGEIVPLDDVINQWHSRERSRTPFVLIVSGMRDWEDWRAICSRLDVILKLRPNLILVHGACPTGADAIADRWARRNGVKTKRYPANWKVYGRRAGLLRNEYMARHGADYCLLFWDGKSVGTGSMYRAARRAGIPTRQVKPGR